MNNAVIKELRVEEYLRVEKSFLVFLATIIIYLSFFKDMARVGFKPDWLLIRLSYLPVILLSIQIRNRLNDWPEIPVVAAGLHITSLCSYFALETGGISSDYLNGLVQFYFGIAIMPISAPVFCGTVISSLTFFVASNLFFHNSTSFDPSAITNMIPLFIFSFIVYLITTKIRTRMFDAQVELKTSLSDRENTIVNQVNLLSKAEKQASMVEIAQQVAHDIRSPLAALEVMLKHLKELPEERRSIVKGAINRIRDIANNLIHRSQNASSQKISTPSTELISKAPLIRASPALEAAKASQQNAALALEPVSSELIPFLIDSIVTEKRIQYRSLIGLEIEAPLDENSYGLFAHVAPQQFSRILSNLINNAVESFDKSTGGVSVLMQKNENFVEVKIVDTGKGIPANIIPHLGERGFSFGESKALKGSGSGLGLYHAKTMVEAWGGSLKIESTVGRGTTIVLSLRRATHPAWFLDKLKLSRKGPVQIKICDDDPSIQALWNSRIRGALNSFAHIERFSDIDAFLNSLQKEPVTVNPRLHLVDYDLGETTRSGLSMIRDLGIENSSILVTSHFDEISIQNEAQKLGVKIIPKPCLAYLPIEAVD